MSERPEVPPDLVARVGAICLGLPEATQENAWTGVRWMIAKKNFAHVVHIENGWPPAYAEAAHTAGPASVLTFRMPIAQLTLPRYARTPFFKPVWFADIIGLLIDARTDWDDVAGFLTASYAMLAPKKLVARLDR